MAQGWVGPGQRLASLTALPLQSKASGTCCGCPLSSTGRMGASFGGCSAGLPPSAPPRPPLP